MNLSRYPLIFGIMELKLTYAVSSDLPYIVEVYNSTVPGGEVTADTEPITVGEWTPWFNRHNLTDRPIHLLHAGGKTCGWMSFSTYKDRPAYDITVEVSIYLEEGHRKKGLGRRFLSMGLDDIGKHGILNVIGLIFTENKPSMRLFEDLGFEAWGVLPRVCVMEGIEKDVSILGKRLC